MSLLSLFDEFIAFLLNKSIIFFKKKNKINIDLKLYMWVYFWKLT